MTLLARKATLGAQIGQTRRIDWRRSWELTRLAALTGHRGDIWLDALWLPCVRLPGAPA